MRPSDRATVCPYLQGAVDDISRVLSAMEVWESGKRELCELYDLMVDGKTPPKVKGRGTAVQLTAKQRAAPAGLKPNCFQVISEEDANALAELPGEPMSDERWGALQFALRGGWRESSRIAAVWLRNAEETVAADGIDVALSRLPDELREAAERETAEYVKTILTAHLQDRPPTPEVQSPAADEGANQSEGTGAVEPPKATKRRGRKADTDPAADKRIADAWKTGRYRNADELAAELGEGVTGKQVRLAIDRDRKRKRNTRRNNSR